MVANTQRERGEREGTQEGEKWKDFCSCFFSFLWCFVFFNGEKRCEKKRELKRRKVGEGEGAKDFFDLFSFWMDSV